MSNSLFALPPCLVVVQEQMAGKSPHFMFSGWVCARDGVFIRTLGHSLHVWVSKATVTYLSPLLFTACLKFSRLGTTDVRREGKGRLKSKSLICLASWGLSYRNSIVDAWRGPGQERTQLSFDVPPTNVAFPFRFYQFIGKADLNIDKR